jgi:adenylate cyclase
VKVLAVDDNPDNIQLITDILDDLGHDVTCAYDGPQALESVEADAPDLILLDVNMPGMSGFDVIARLKADQRTSGIPVIMLTALAGIDYRVEGLGLGADDYLTKPFSPRELIARIETRLRAKSANDNLRNARQAIQATFERYVAPEVVQQLINDPARIELGGQLQEITVLFADMQSFTAISEHVDPEKLLTVLNQYHGLIVGAIQANKGTIDKFIGDAVMALYNTPLELERHPLRAVQTALTVREALAEFHTQFEPGLRMDINFGIHTGKAVVGNVGTSQIMNFTAVGDTVNVAARLQATSHDGQILISESTYARVQDQIDAELLGPVQLKNRQVPVMVYAIRGLLT